MPETVQLPERQDKCFLGDILGFGRGSERRKGRTINGALMAGNQLAERRRVPGTGQSDKLAVGHTLCRRFPGRVCWGDAARGRPAN
jgi:hypothetical protein